jgi:hypothetical protein
MATGILGTKDCAATTYEALYTVPADTFSVVSISVLNRTAANKTIRLAVTATTPPIAPNNAEFIEYEVQLSPNGVLERTGLVLDANKSISVYSSDTGVSAVAMGIETATA